MTLISQAKCSGLVALIKLSLIFPPEYKLFNVSNLHPKDNLSFQVQGLQSEFRDQRQSDRSRHQRAPCLLKRRRPHL